MRISAQRIDFEMPDGTHHTFPDKGTITLIQVHASRKFLASMPLGKDGRLAVTPRTEQLFRLPAIDLNPLSGWHAHLVTFQRRKCVLMAHDNTRFPLFLPALTKPDFKEFNDRFFDAFMNTLLKCSADEVHMETAQALLRPVQIDTQCDRSVQGTINQMKFELSCLVEDDGLNVAEITGYRAGAWLADTPRTIKAKGTLWPKDAMLALLDGIAGRQHQRARSAL
jgi:hypothetical protein